MQPKQALECTKAIEIAATSCHMTIIKARQIPPLSCKTMKLQKTALLKEMCVTLCDFWFPLSKVGQKNVFIKCRNFNSFQSTLICYLILNVLELINHACFLYSFREW